MHEAWSTAPARKILAKMVQAIAAQLAQEGELSCGSHPLGNHA
jgi:hypothetical protein